MRRTLTFISIFALLISMLALPAAGETEYENTTAWDQVRGLDSQKCEKVGEGEPGQRPPEGWIHWIGNQSSVPAGPPIEAKLNLSGTGEGEYLPTKAAPVIEFFTPYFPLKDAEGAVTLTAVVSHNGSIGGGLIISDWCAGDDNGTGLEGELTVVKTVDTEFVREHFWDIDKSVETQEGYELDDAAKIWLYTDGSGDETATWTVDTTYEGYEDGGHNVSGTITISNTGGIDLTIESVTDVLAGEPIDVDCGDAVFPYEIAVEGELTCTYDEDGFVEGNNVATVSVQDVDGEPFGPFTDTQPIVWGEPATETNATVSITDISDLFGEKDLGTVTAPNGHSWAYTKAFAWEDYGQDGCGGYQYDNTASIVETEQSATATLKTNVQCFKFDSAWAKGDPEELGGDSVVSFCEAGFNNWGWTNHIGPGEYEFDLWAGAGRCDTERGTLVGSVTVEYDDYGHVTETFNVDDEYLLDDSTAFHAGYDKFPTLRNGRSAVAPGQYTNASPFDDSKVWTIAHANVGIPDPDFGP